MPGGDGTGPWWGQNRNWRCWRNKPYGGGFGRGFGWRYWQNIPYTENVELSKEEQKKILLAEKEAIEKKLKELE